jgi:hypothetical protein
LKKIVNDFLNSLEKVPGSSSEEKIENSTLIDLIQGYKELVSEKDHIQFNNDRIIRAFADHLSVSKNKNGGIDNLGPEMIDLLQNLL